MRRVRAYRGELGLKVYRHVPQVHALCLSEPTVVEIEPGDEALYPAAHSWEYTTRADDDDRHGGPRRVHREERRFVPDPYEPPRIGPVDVVVCPRRRAYGSSKNWPHWPTLTDTLTDRGLSVYAAGAPDSSYDVDAPRAWEHDRFLDASIEAIRKARLVVATDAGLAHLAVLCGAGLLMVTYEGRTAPGPVVDAGGKVLKDRYGPVKMDRYLEANHTGSSIETVDGWEDVEWVEATVMDVVSEREAA